MAVFAGYFNGPPTIALNGNSSHYSRTVDQNSFVFTVTRNTHAQKFTF